MGHMQFTLKNFKCFITIKDAINELKIHAAPAIEERLGYFINTGILPSYVHDNDKYVLINDLNSILPALCSPLFDIDNLFKSVNLENLISLDRTTKIILPKDFSIYEAGFFTAVRNLIIAKSNIRDEQTTELIEVPYLANTKIITTSPFVMKFASEQKAHSTQVLYSQSSQFANSSYYMGSKRSLKSFLSESISLLFPKQGLILDLMCGSGSATGAFNLFWKTYASDAQDFCKKLATIQGRGMTKSIAENLLTQLLPNANMHADSICKHIGSFLQLEDKLFNSDITYEILSEYCSFVENYPTYPYGNKIGAWNPVQEVMMRKENPGLSPYCLFTSYFANVYFGLRQCVEIDSLRYAIDQITCEKSKDWALGALVATISYVGTTHAGHFAQPGISDYSKISLEKLRKVFEKRALSVIHEFSIRLINLAMESEKALYEVQTLPGPWQNALEGMDRIAKDSPVLVYVDAPYTREEYSRYYHALETVVSYNYPAAIGKGKTPDKKIGERFRSEFFSKSSTLVKNAFVKVFSQILERDWVCAWSYSDNGAINIISIIEELSDNFNLHIISFATRYKHKSHGRRTDKEVTEYLIVFKKVP